MPANSPLERANGRSNGNPPARVAAKTRRRISTRLYPDIRWTSIGSVGPSGRFLLAVGEDPDREGLRETPDRVARMYAEVFEGLHQDPRVHPEKVCSRRNTTRWS